MIERVVDRLCTSRNALIVGVLLVVLTAASVALGIATSGVTQGVLVLPFGIVGYVIARRQPRNPIGWILLIITVTFMVVRAPPGNTRRTSTGKGTTRCHSVGWRRSWRRRWIWLPALLPLTIGLFPDGRLSRRWRLVLRIYLVDAAIFIGDYFVRNLQGVTAHHISVDSSGGLTSLDHSVRPGWSARSSAPSTPFWPCSRWPGSRVKSFAFRGSVGDRRQQLKWLMTGGAIAVLALILTLTAGGAGFVGIVALPISLGIGILKYRLYDIDRLVSRTLSYAIITGLLVGVYVGLIALTTRALPLSSPVGVAGSTLTAAALFAPLRRWVQHGVDRKFNRAHYDAEATIAQFRASVRDEVDLPSVRSHLLEAVQLAVQPTHVDLWVRERTTTQ